MSKTNKHLSLTSSLKEHLDQRTKIKAKKFIQKYSLKHQKVMLLCSSAVTPPSTHIPEGEKKIQIHHLNNKKCVWL